jgi:hypothetical protein
MRDQSLRRLGVDGRVDPRIKSGDGHDDGGSGRNRQWPDQQLTLSDRALIGFEEGLAEAFSAH